MFIGWLLVLLAQVVLVHAGRTDVHRRFGPWLAAYGFAVAAYGTWAGMVLAARWLEFGRTFDDAASFSFSIITDMAMFAGFLAAAIAYRRQPEAHKRLMLLATWSLVLVGCSRLLGHLMGPPAHPLERLYQVLPLVVIVVWDSSRRGKVHPVWIVGLVLYMLRAYRRYFSDSELWLPVGWALLKPFV